MEKILEMHGITKRFPGVVANENVDLVLYKGEVHALLGENGAGKSTLMNILTGMYFPNAGQILYKGSPVEIDSPEKAVKLGIGMVHQHFKLVDTLTVAENIALYSHAEGRFINYRKMMENAEKLSSAFHLAIDPARTVGELSIGEQQRVEILKILSTGAEVLILDEPTAVLTPKESEILFTSLRQMADQGKAVLVITHKLGEVIGFADRATILQNGKSVGTMLIKDTNAEDITHMMVGHHVEGISNDRKHQIGKPVLELKEVCSVDDRNVAMLKDVSFVLHQGEILGIAGVAGNGQRELCEVIAGLRSITSGNMMVKGKECGRWDAKAAVNRGVSYIPDDRIGIGLAGHLNAMDNLVMKDFTSPRNSRFGILRKKEVRTRCQEIVEKYDIRCAGLDYPVSFMSGGNIQKLLIAREVDLGPDIIIASYPTHGLDIGATESVHRILLGEGRKGKAVLFISEDLDELFEISDRIAVMCSGRLKGSVDIADASIRKIGSMMLDGMGEEHAIQYTI